MRRIAAIAITAAALLGAGGVAASAAHADTPAAPYTYMHG